MRNCKWMIVGACGLGFVLPAHAQTETSPQTRTRPGFEVGAELHDYKYRERFDGQEVARDDGTFGGVAISYVETIGGGRFLRARSTSTFGSVDYSSADGQIDDVSQDIGQLELQLGQDFLLGGVTTLTAFTGVAGRVLTDNSGGKETASGALGYDREISYAYVPVGIAASYPFGGGSTLTLSGQVNWIVGGTAESKFSEIDPEFPDVKLDLEGGHGFEASAMLAVPVGRNAIRFGPFVRHWNVDRSESAVFEEEDLEIELFEPGNKTTELGLRLSFAF